MWPPTHVNGAEYALRNGLLPQTLPRGRRRAPRVLPTHSALHLMARRAHTPLRALRLWDMDMDMDITRLRMGLILLKERIYILIMGITHIRMDISRQD